VLAAALAAACDSPLDTNPTASIDAETALNTPRGVELALTGAYQSLQSGSLWSRDGVVYPDLYADNLDFTGTFQTDRSVSLRDVPASSGVVSGIWTATYNGINRANNVLAAIPNVSALSSADASLYRGEALFIRALHYSVLLAWFGGVPIVTEPSKGVSEASLVSRETAQEVYAFIEQDLEEAATLLPAGHLDGRASRQAANALLARIYLEEGKYALARDKAGAVINSGNYGLVPDYREVFTDKNSDESIFELQYSINNTNSLAFWFFTQALGGRWGFSPSLGLWNAYEAGDERRDASIGLSGSNRYGFKYFRITNEDDNVIVLRLAEMYLIRAEANARLNADPALVRSDINTVRARAGLGLLATTVTGAALLDAVLQERRVELAMEGHRYFDLRRLGRAEQVLNLAAHRLIWPIPQVERDVNPNLEQNPGY
jgi:hypothetical protein